ncbi:MAG: hypothetical protein ACYDHP_00710 [Ferrimicrobium sp.]
MSTESLRKRLAEATSGPWKVSSCRTMATGDEYGVNGPHGEVILPTPYICVEDTEFIAHARTDLEVLLELAEAATTFVVDRALDNLSQRPPHTHTQNAYGVLTRCVAKWQATP